MNSKINVELFDKAVAIMEEQYSFEPWKLTKTGEANFIKNFGEEVGTFFINHSYSSGWRFGSNLFSQVYMLHKINFMPSNQEIYKKGYYIIGTGLNEDLIVLNTNLWTIGYLDSDLFYRSKDVEFDDMYVDTGLDLGTFYYRSLIEGDAFYGRAKDVK
ncbi:MAG: hypothetical protein LBI72_00660 [Flavobacteriaceae bacterium]|jgi:hypothetical protein|nr:hypothetical protein [Flavobacteriaceae bacterium]